MNTNEGNDNIATEIGEVIKEMNVAEKTNEPAPAATAAPAEAAPVEKTEETPKFVADDALIERAVKAGMSVADAKQFTSAEMADRFLGMLESKGETPKSESDGDEQKPEGFPGAELEKVIAEMEADGGYDPNIVAMNKSLFATLKAQHEEIAALKSARATADAQTSFDKAFAGLDEGVRSHVDAATKSQLKKTFDFLKNAHESAKDGADDGKIFDEAKKLALGDVVSQAAEASKAEAIAKRNSLALARPGGESGARNGAPMSETDIVNTLFDAITKK